MEELKYVNTEVVFQEVPDEISLAINISGCPIHCPDCHSKFLWENVGTILDIKSLYQEIKKQKGITCVCFMGGDKREEQILYLASYTKEVFPKLKIAWYLGRETLDICLNYKNIDYIKLGPYNKEFGGLDNPKTNQKMFYFKHINNGFILIKDITYKFKKS